MARHQDTSASNTENVWMETAGTSSVHGLAFLAHLRWPLPVSAKLSSRDYLFNIEFQKLITWFKKEGALLLPALRRADDDKTSTVGRREEQSY